MLKALHIKNYVLIDSLDIEFPTGLIIITGQTGAGKSIILGAISLALGSKSDASVIGKSGDNCVVEAEFEISDEDGSVRAYLDENEVDFDNGELIVRRVISSAGRSRSFINDSPVSQKVLATLASRLIDIHSQHETMLLSDKAFQLSMLDHFACAMELREKCRAAWKNLTDLRSELSGLIERLDKVRAEQDYNQTQYDQLAAANLVDGEIAELETEQRQLANAEEIKSSLFQVMENCSPSDSDDGRMSVDSVLKESSRLLDKISGYVPAATKLSERIESSRLELDDILSEVSELESRTEVSDERLQAVDDRLSQLYDLLHKHNCRDEAELIALRDKLSSDLADTGGMEARKIELEKAVSTAESAHKADCASLHEARMAAIPEFANSVCESVRSLELDRAVFDVVLGESQPGPDGADSILFRFSSTGREPVDVAKCASGGEMSRIMLCLKAMMARYTNMPSMIFDEIDTGVSGSVADKMGTMICAMGEYMQVFAITHLPQVAAKGNAHYVVTKDIDDSRAVTSIRKISGDERVMEIARLLSGAEVTPAAVSNAKVLLGTDFS